MGVTLSLAKFNRILDVDPDSRTAVVQCGVRNLAISEAAAPYDLYYAPDPSSQIACTIGGNVAENSGGVHCLKYGLTVHNVLQGEGLHHRRRAGRIRQRGAGRPRLRPAGRRDRQRGHAGRGHRSHRASSMPKPQLARCIMASFDDVRKAGDAVAAVIAAGIIPAGLEMMDKPMTAAVEDFVKAGYDLTAEAILLCESDGTPEEVEEEIGRMSEVLRAAGATAISVSQRRGRAPALLERPQERLPRQRPHQPRLHVHGLDHSAQAPGRHPAGHRRRWRKKYQLRCANVFHAGDGNLHPLILFDANDPDELHRCELFGADILETSVAMGGTVTGEHGVGVEKLNSMCTQFTTEENAQMFGAQSTRSTRPGC